MQENQQKNKNIQPGPEKQHSYKKKKSVMWDSGVLGLAYRPAYQP